MKKVERKQEETIFWEQLKAILVRDLKLNIRTVRFLMVFLLTQTVTPIVLSVSGYFEGRVVAYYSTIILNGTLSRTVIIGQVEERAKKFRSTFRLMGLRDNAYLAGTFLGYVCMILIGMALVTVGNLFFNYDYMFSWEFFHFQIFSLLSSCAILSMNLILSFAIKNPKIAGDISGIYTFVIVFIPLSLANNDEWWVVLFYFVPQVVFTQDMNYTNEYGEVTRFYIMLMIIILALYILLYLYLDKVIPNENGLSKDPFFFLKYKSKNPKKKGQATNRALQQSDIDLNGNGGSQKSNGAPKKVIEVKHLVKQFGNFKAVNNISFQIDSNKVTCILGHNGAGKSTLINMMCGILKATSGQILFKGKNIFEHPEVIDGMIGYCAAFDVLYDGFSVIEYLEFVACLKSIQNPDEHIKDLLERFRLEKYKNNKIGTLSYGERRRVTILTAVLGEPPIVFLDEPSSGIDPQNRRFLWEIIESLTSEDRVVILTTHHLEEAEALAEDVVVMSRGKILIKGNPNYIKKNFGIGYMATFKTRDPNDKDYIAKTTNTMFQDPHLDVSGYQKTRTIKVTIPITEVSKSERFIRKMESKGISFGLKSNNLEEAFVKMGEREFKTQSNKFKNMEKKIEELSKVEYTATTMGQISALFYRRFLLMSNIPIQIIILVVVVIFPGFIILFSLDNITEVNNSFDVKVVYKELASMVFFLSICVLCSVFVYVPCYERSCKMRYLMQKIGVESTMYYLVLFASDLLIGFGMTLLGFVFMFLILSVDHGIGLKREYFALVFENYLWLSTFIGQSYIISFMFNSIVGSTRIAPLLLLSTSIAIIIPMLANNTLMIWLTFIVFPISCFMAIQINEVTKSTPALINFTFNMTKVEGFWILFYSTIFYILVAIYWDHAQYKKRKVRLMHNAEKSYHYVIDRKSVSKEREICKQPSSDYFIQASSIMKTFATKEKAIYALKRMDMALRKNEILGLIGPNGAGKTTLLNLLGSYHRRSGGEIYLNGERTEDDSTFFDECGLCLQEDIFWDDLSVYTHLRIICQLKGVDYGIIEDWLKILGLDNFREYKTFTLSSGMKRKLCFGMCMIFNPKVKLMDEPSTGLDPIAQKFLRAMIKCQQKSNKGSTIFITQTMSEAESLCDRIAIMVNGGLCCITETEKLKQLAGGYHLIISRNSAKVRIQSIKSIKNLMSENGDSELSLDIQSLLQQPDVGLFASLGSPKRKLEIEKRGPGSVQGDLLPSQKDRKNRRMPFKETEILNTDQLPINRPGPRKKNVVDKSKTPGPTRKANHSRKIALFPQNLQNLDSVRSQSNASDIQEHLDKLLNKKSSGVSNKEVLKIISRKANVRLDLIQETDNMLKANILKYDNLTSIFKTCNLLKAEGMIDDFWVSEMNLEDIFLICTKEKPLDDLDLIKFV